MFSFNPFKHQPNRWSNTLKQFVDKLPMNCLRVFDRSVGLALKRLILHKHVLDPAKHP